MCPVVDGGASVNWHEDVEVCVVFSVDIIHVQHYNVIAKPPLLQLNIYNLFFLMRLIRIILHICHTVNKNITLLSSRMCVLFTTTWMECMYVDNCMVDPTYFFVWWKLNKENSTWALLSHAFAFARAITWWIKHVWASFDQQPRSAAFTTAVTASVGVGTDPKKVNHGNVANSYRQLCNFCREGSLSQHTENGRLAWVVAPLILSLGDIKGALWSFWLRVALWSAVCMSQRLLS